MENTVIRPERGQLTIWLLMLALFGLPVLIGCVILIYTVHPLTFGLCTIGWLLLILFMLWWIPAYFKSLEYTLDEDAVRGKLGVFWRRHVTVPYRKITNVDVTQGPVQRQFNIGTIHLQTAGAGGQQGSRAELMLVGVTDYNSLRDALLNRIKGLIGTEQATPVPAEPFPGSPDTLTQILAQLQAIRQLLEERQT
jgi:membrane protein YdbS with pleckstrin-like domain